MLFLGLGCNIFLGLRLSCYALSAISRRLATAVAHLLYCSPRDKDADEKWGRGRMGGDGVGSREFPEEKIVLKIYFSWRKNVKLTHNSTPDGKRKILFIGGPTKKTSKFVREFPEEKKSVEFCEKISLAFNQYVLRSFV